MGRQRSLVRRPACAGAQDQDYVNSFSAAQIDGSDGREIHVPRRTSEPLVFSGENYLRHYALPNLYFHLTAAYALLRQAGVELGKADFLGGR